MFAACDGTGKLPGTDCRMDGFNHESSRTAARPSIPSTSTCRTAESKPYFDMAHEWVLADRMFQSQLDESFVAHQYVIAAQAASERQSAVRRLGLRRQADDTVADDHERPHLYGPNIEPCFDYQTLGDELDKAELSWRFYASQYGSASSGDGADWSSYQAVKHIHYGPDWKKRHLTELEVHHRRARREARELHLDHAGLRTTPITSTAAAATGRRGSRRSSTRSARASSGTRRRSSCSGTIGAGSTTTLPPPYKDYDGLGFRVPLLVISPYAKQNYVSHVQYETASVLRFAEDLWGLGQLAAADKRANSPAEDCFDFSQSRAPVREDRRAAAAEILHAPAPQRLLRPRLRVASPRRAAPARAALMLCSRGVSKTRTASLRRFS